MKRVILVIVVFFSSIQLVKAQRVWKLKANNSNVSLENINVIPHKYQLFSLENDRFTYQLKASSKKSNTIELPTNSGKSEKYILTEASNFAPELAAKFPSIKTYNAVSLDGTKKAKISIGSDGMYATIYKPGTSTVYLDPVSKDKKTYMLYAKNHYHKHKSDVCLVEDSMNATVGNLQGKQAQKNADDGKLRTYRIAIITTGEYSQFHLNRQGISASASDAVKKAAVLSAVNTTMTRVNGVFERDLAVRMEIVANNDKIIFLNSVTDNLTNNSASSLINESQSVCDSQIGAANYDIGHAFSTGAGGLAGLGVVCINGQKARGVTGRSAPIGDPYDIDFVAHEIGHQFGANHTQNNDCNRNNGTAIEPGSASTIMGYAGICTPNVQNNSDDYFHAVSIDEMWATIQSTATCATITNTGNAAPVANAGLDYRIPPSTPFVLTGSATDADSNNLTYNWEQTDNETATMPPVSTNSGGPMFRSFQPTTSSKRYFPKFSDVLNGTSSTWEVLPSISRDLNFALVVRDNETGGGASARDDMKVEVVDSEPFTIATPPTWAQNTQQTITWSVGKTNQNPINVQKVSIKLSTNGGSSFDRVLIAETDNDGSEILTMPNIASTSDAVLLIEPIGNIFYNVTKKFTVSSESDFAISNLSGDISVCGSTETQYKINYVTSNGFNETTSFSLTGNPPNTSVNISPSTISTNGEVIVTIGSLNAVSANTYNMTLTARSSSKTKTIPLKLIVSNGICASSGNTTYNTSTTQVIFNTINNQTGKVNGYSDFTSLISTTVKQKNIYQIRVSTNTDSGAETYSTRTYVWIDWNQNCILEGSEQYDLGTVTGSNNGATSLSPLSIEVPEDAVEGKTTMRVSTKFTGDGNPNSCEIGFDGEVEDYAIVVEKVTNSVDDYLFDKFRLYPNPTQNEINVSFSVLNTKNVTINVLDFQGRMLQTKSFKNVRLDFSEKINVQSLSKGIYLLQIINDGKQTTKKIIVN